MNDLMGRAFLGLGITQSLCDVGGAKLFESGYKVNNGVAAHGFFLIAGIIKISIITFEMSE